MGSAWIWQSRAEGCRIGRPRGGVRGACCPADLPTWPRWLVRRRLRRLFGTLWMEHLEVFPYNPQTTVLGALLHQARDGRPTGRGRQLTDGQVHRTLAGTPWGLSAGELDRQLRRLGSCW
jgi:hypothetical protein